MNFLIFFFLLSSTVQRVVGDYKKGVKHLRAFETVAAINYRYSLGHAYFGLMTIGMVFSYLYIT